MSKLYTENSFKKSGTLSLIMLYARPSAIAVLPTPGSPTISTLFFALRPNASAKLSSSLLRPIIGSTLPFLTSSFKLVVKLFNAFFASDAASGESSS